MTAGTGRPLEGVGVLVTRPAHQAAGLAQRVADLGGIAVLFPGLAIEPLAPPALDLSGVDLAVFVSPNAVDHAVAPLLAAGGLPPTARIAAVGSATAARIEASGIRTPGAAPLLVPHAGFDSEALLEHLPAADVAGRRVLIFRGEGGRALLGEALRARGARVEYVQTYRRRRPQADLGELAHDWRQGRIGATLATSAEIVTNLFAMAGAAAHLLRGTPMFVPHPKVAAAAFHQGVQSLMVAGNGDEALASGLATWFGRLRPEPSSQSRA
jgi:uroporphyrinogen-III synthase